jgi:hypothetical protein
MTPATDPYQTLGLSQGATPAEIKRAYRRLAKAYHPDSAGERALPRFLAIQAAYERLTTGQPGGPPASGRPQSSPRRPASPGPTAQPPGRPWSADAERARATREGFRKRTTRSAGGPNSGTSSGTGTGTGAGGGGPASAAGTRGPASGRGSSRRGRPKASIGSTSYDGTENEPFEPGWAGATWYGADSGTYWTINPKEYADPRKHGPEYLARAQRPLGTAGETSIGAVPGAAPTAAQPAPAVEPAQPAATPAREPVPRQAPVSSSVSSSGPPVGRFDSLDPARVLRSWRGRLLLVGLAWFPIGLAIFGVHGQVTGCAQFLASCTEPVAWSVWIPQVIVLALLALSPRLAWIAASGSLVLFGLTAPLAAILTAGSGGRPPSAATTGLLLATMALGWLAGVGLALSGRIPLPPWRAPRVR